MRNDFQKLKAELSQLEQENEINKDHMIESYNEGKFLELKNKIQKLKKLITRKVLFHQ